MSVAQRQNLAPFISILFLVFIAVGSLFLKMEVVRQGYELVSLGHSHKTALHEKATLDLHYTKLTRPQRLDYIATQRLALNRAHKDQVVLMAAGETFSK